MRPKMCSAHNGGGGSSLYRAKETRWKEVRVNDFHRQVSEAK